MSAKARAIILRITAIFIEGQLTFAIIKAESLLEAYKTAKEIIHQVESQVLAA